MYSGLHEDNEYRDPGKNKRNRSVSRITVMHVFTSVTYCIRGHGPVLISSLVEVNYWQQVQNSVFIVRTNFPFRSKTRLTAPVNEGEVVLCKYFSLVSFTHSWRQLCNGNQEASVLLFCPADLTELSGM